MYFILIFFFSTNNINQTNKNTYEHFNLCDENILEIKMEKDYNISDTSTNILNKGINNYTINQLK